MLQAEMLQDPYTHDELKLEGTGGAVNPESGRKYPLKQGFLAFLGEAEAEGSNKKYLELYNRIARYYRLSNKAYFVLKFGGERRYREQFLSSLELREGDRVLETSVGSGDNFPYLGVQQRCTGWISPAECSSRPSAMCAAGSCRPICSRDRRRGCLFGIKASIVSTMSAELIISVIRELRYWK